jgi:hypothetical protein
MVMKGEVECSCDHGFKYVNTAHYVTLMFNVHVESVKHNDGLIYCRNVILYLLIIHKHLCDYGRKKNTFIILYWSVEHIIDNTFMVLLALQAPLH